MWERWTCGRIDIEVHSIDIYASPTVDLICDAHYLPLEGEYYDAVWIQAVLEHVVQPELVVHEIHRVLKPDGIVYAETPFMQQVNEGAYDFTRYTVLGHRYLFKKFSLIDRGAMEELVFLLLGLLNTSHGRCLGANSSQSDRYSEYTSASALKGCLVEKRCLILPLECFF